MNVSVNMQRAPQDNNKPFLAELRRIVGAGHVLTGKKETGRYRTGFRFGSGNTLAVVRPGSLVEQWKVLRACVAANKIIIMQAANTGLTGGSTPDGEDYDRDIVIVNTLRVDQLHLIDGGKQIIAFPGTTLYALERALKPLGREPHSVIGSSCIGASVVGGICNNSGGALIRRGPAYTEMAIYARLNQQGEMNSSITLASTWATIRKACCIAWKPRATLTPIWSMRAITAAMTMTMRPMSATSRPDPRPALMPIPASCSKHRAAPEE